MMKLHSTMSTIQGDTFISSIFTILDSVATIQKYTMQVCYIFTRYYIKLYYCSIKNC